MKNDLTIKLFEKRRNGEKIFICKTLEYEK